MTVARPLNWGNFKSKLTPTYKNFLWVKRENCYGKKLFVVSHLFFKCIYSKNYNYQIHSAQKIATFKSDIKIKIKLNKIKKKNAVKDSC